MQDTAIFTIDKEKNEIISLTKDIKDYLKLKFISVTTDQPIYWPNEEVYLKVLMPVNPSQKIKITLQKKDSTPKDLGEFTLNDSGLLVENILSGKDKKIEAGEYKVEVETIDKKLQSYTSFSVVQGSLGALSFGYDFEEITEPKKLEKVKGGWFLGNAAGAGSRWGNGLNVKNEVRYFNEPYTGTVTIKTRCFLPGCNGVEAGASIEKKIKAGLLEAVLDVSSHSGPFELEVITDKASIRHLFGRSGHVERQSIQISSNLTNNFSATLAPYEGTMAVYGKEIYIIKEGSQDDMLELVSPICNEENKIELKVKENILNPKIFLIAPSIPISPLDKPTELSPLDKGGLRGVEIPLSKKLEKGKNILIDCFSPFTFIAIGGFIKKEKKIKFYEGWGIAFTQSPIDIEISSPESANPLKAIELDIKTSDRYSKKQLSTYGILEVFDNRVSSKSPKEPLISSIGDCTREFSNYLSSWRDTTGIFDKDDEFKVCCECMAAEEALNAPLPPPMLMAAQASFGGLSKMKKAAAPSPVTGALAYEPSPEVKPEPVLEKIREGEKKVIYCDIVKTDENGTAKVNVELPPQTGRCKIRYVAINKFDYLEKTKDIDVKKENYVEINVQPLLIPDAQIYAKAHVTNIEKENLKLKIVGAGLDKELFYDIKPGSEEIEFQIKGKNYGSLHIELTDSNGKKLDTREIKIKDISSIPVTFSDVIISDGTPILIEKGKKVTVYSNPALLLQGIISNIITTMYSWFGHSEALSASAAVRGILLKAIEEKIINDEGMRDTLKSDLIKVVKDLYETFYNKSTGLFHPYPGVVEHDLWSVWAAKNLNIMLTSLDSCKALKKEFKETITISKEMIEMVKKYLKKKSVLLEENGLYDFEQGQDLIPVEIDDKVVYKVLTDDSVVKWYVDKMLPLLDNLPISPFDKGGLRGLEDLNVKFIKAYDTYRFLRAFERTGSIYYLLLNAKALLLKEDKNFYPLFNQIAKGLILTQEPGLMQGPALLGGVYSAPQTVIKFLDLLIIMAKNKKIKHQADITVKTGFKPVSTKNITISDKPYILEAKDEEITINAPEFVTIRFDEQKEINFYDYFTKRQFFKVYFEIPSHSPYSSSSSPLDKGGYRGVVKPLKIGEEGIIKIELDKDKDPTEYYAIIAVPSVLSVRQTDDLLSDYKGQLLYGQRASGGEKIQFLTVPFRGKREMILNVQASQKGESEGFVLVRHISNPDIIVTGKMDVVRVK